MGKAVRPQAGWTGGGVVARVLAVVLGVAGHLLLLAVTMASGLVAPAWAVVAFLVLWLAAAALLVVSAVRRPLLSPLVPLLHAALLVLAVTAGELWLGWTA